MNIYPANGNPKIAAMIMNFALFGKDTEQNLRDSILKAQVDELYLSFSSEEKVKNFVESLGPIARCYVKDLTVSVMPAYSSAENAAKIMNIAILDYGAYLISINKLTIGFSSEEYADEFIENIKKYVNDDFGSGAFSLKEL